MSESHISLEQNFEVLVPYRNEMSEVTTEEKISSIWALVYKGASEDRAYLRHKSESPASSLGRDGTGAKARVGLVRN